MVTLRPAFNKAMAMPVPMVPPPITPTVSMERKGRSRGKPGMRVT
jgi:hypothetical protein